MRTFKIGEIVYQIISDNFFGLTPHYGVVWYDANGNYHSGWIPVVLVRTLEAL